MKKTFTMLQLFSILDGRLSTQMGDVYEILNHITGEELMTHHLPTAMKYIKEVNPLWFADLVNKTNEIVAKCPIKERTEEQFLWIMDYFKENNTIHEIPQLTEEEKKGFETFMIDNSLLKTIGSKA